MKNRNCLRVLITGGAGAIGMGIIEALGTDSETSKFYQLDGAAISLDNYASSERFDESKKIGGVRYLECDLSNPYRRPHDVDKNDNPIVKRRTGRAFDNTLDCDLGQKANYHKQGFKMGNPDVIFHCAGLSHTFDISKNVDNFKEYQHADKYPMDLFDANVIGTKNILEFAIHGQYEGDIDIRTSKRFTDIIGHEWKNPKYAQIFYISCEPDSSSYVDEYQFTKWQGEELCKFYHKQFNLNVGIFSFQGITLNKFCERVVGMVGKDLKGKKYVFRRKNN